MDKNYSTFDASHQYKTPSISPTGIKLGGFDRDIQKSKAEDFMRNFNQSDKAKLNLISSQKQTKLHVKLK